MELNNQAEPSRGPLGALTTSSGRIERNATRTRTKRRANPNQSGGDLDRATRPVQRPLHPNRPNLESQSISETKSIKNENRRAPALAL